MKEEQEEREEIERKEREQWDTDPKVEQLEGIQASIVMASSLAKEAEDVSAVDFHKACSNEKSRENECSNGEPSTKGKFSQKNSYAINIDRREIRNCYVCEDFGHLTRNYRNRRVEMNRRMKIDNNNNLNGEGDLIVFD